MDPSGGGSSNRRRRGGGGGGGGSTATCKGLNMDKWECPTSWTTGGTAPSDAKDAKAFVAAHNIFRCMHDVQAVQWDDSVYKSAKTWARATGKSMSHSTAGTQYRKNGDGENLAGTFKFSKHPGVDATHMWYEEIWNPCHWSQKCYQSFNAGHFTAMIWKSITKIAYSDTTGELAVGRYRDCLGNGPNFNGEYKKFVPPQKHNWAFCVNKVLKSCPAFSDVKENDVEGCGKQSSAWSSSSDWHMVYPKKCSSLYSGVHRLYDIPEFLQPLMSNPWPLAIACASIFALFLVIAVKRSGTLKNAPSSRILMDVEATEALGEGLE